MRVSQAFAQEAPAPDPGAGATPHRWPEPKGDLGPPAPSRMSLLDPKTRENVEAFATQIKAITRLATDRPIASAEEARLITEGLVTAKQAHGTLEAARKKAIAPYEDKVDTINGIFAPLIKALGYKPGAKEGFAPRAKRLLVAWTIQEKARVDREQQAARKAQEEAAAREAEALARVETAETKEERTEALAAAEDASRAQTEAMVAAPVSAPTRFDGGMGSAGLKHPWKFEVVKEDLVPRQYLAVDQKAIRAAVAAGVREIPGVNIFQEDQVAVRIG